VAQRKGLFGRQTFDDLPFDRPVSRKTRQRAGIEVALLENLEALASSPRRHGQAPDLVLPFHPKIGVEFPVGDQSGRCSSFLSGREML
jgi:hypothetical protein